MRLLVRFLTGWTVLLVVIAVAAPSTAHAAGLGLFGGEGSGSSDSSDSRNKGVEFSNMAVGLVLDTSVAKNKIFNYRLKIGYATQNYKNRSTLDNSSSRIDTTLKGIALDNTFGLGIIRTPSVRVWVGPCIRLSFLLSDNDKAGTMQHAGAGIAAVLGVNYHLGSTVSFGIEAGYMLQYLTGSADSQTNTQDSESMTESFPFVNGVLLFRLKDDP